MNQKNQANIIVLKRAEIFVTLLLILSVIALLAVLAPKVITVFSIQEEPLLGIQTTFTSQPGSEGKDARIWNGTHASTNYGNDSWLSIADGGADGIISSLIQFNLSSIPSNAIILNANLSLQPDAVLDVAVYRVTQSWDEQTVTWNNKPSCDTVLIDSKTTNNLVRTQFNVTNSVQKFVNGTYTNYGWYLKANKTSIYGMSFYSSDYGTSSYRPKLVVDYYLSCGGGTACSCGDTIISNTILTGNLNCADKGLIIGANDITIDCNGHSITGAGANPGIDITEGGFNRTKINNCTIKNFSYGIYLYSAHNSTINNSNINSTLGIFLDNSNNNKIINSEVRSTFDRTLLLTSSSGNEISNSYFSLAGSSVPVVDIAWYSSNNKLINSTIFASSQAYSGITIEDNSVNNQLNNCTIIADNLINHYYAAIDIAVNNNSLTNTIVRSLGSGTDFSSGASNISVVNMTFNSSAYPTTASFTFSGNIKIDSINAIADSGSLRNISKYLNITNSTAASINLNISYRDSDLEGINESFLKLYKYSGAAWQLVPGSGVDTVRNVVYGTLNSFSVFAPLSGPQCGENITSSMNLLRDMSCNGTALNIGADNLVIDCNGHSITGNGTGNGIDATTAGAGYNITMKNCNIKNFSVSIDADGAASSPGGNGGALTIINSNLNNISCYGGYGNIGDGGNGGNLIITNSSITSIDCPGGDSTGDIGGDGGSITITNSDIVTVKAYGAGGNSMQGGSGGSITIINSSITIADSYGGYGEVNGGSGGNITIINSNLNLTAMLVNLSKANGGNTNGTAGTLKLNNSVFFTNYGKIKFFYVQTNQTAFSSIMSISNDLITLDSDNYPDYNQSSNLTIYNPPVLGSPIIIRNGVECNQSTAPSCYNFTALTLSTVVFNVSSWTSYAISGVSCGNGSVDYGEGEMCDPPIGCTSYYAVNCTYCTSSCQNATNSSGYCGDHIVQSANETCDGGTASCTVGGYSGTKPCNSTCTGYGTCTTTQYCGDGDCNGPETKTSCATDCETGGDGGGGGGGGGGGLPPEEEPLPAPLPGYTLEEVTGYNEFKSITLTAGVNDIIYFTTIDTEQHSITINNIDSGAETVTVTISSEPFEVVLTLGEPVNIDANDDGFDDFTLTLEGFAGEDVLISFKKLAACGDKICESTENSENCCTDCSCESGECKDNSCVTIIQLSPSLGKWLIYGAISAGAIIAIIILILIVRKILKNAESKGKSRFRGKTGKKRKKHRK
jgi:hypothetical protein